MKKKILVSSAAVILALCLVIGGTMAWLVDDTAEVKNTFTVGDINIELKETTGTSYKMVPGSSINKDPKVTVKANSEACYLFVKIDESSNFDDFITYAIADGWTFYNTAATGSSIDTATNDSYYIYRTVAASTSDTSFSVLSGDTVSVKGTVEKSAMEALTATTYPTLKFKAYAVQSANVADVATAYGIITG